MTAQVRYGRATVEAAHALDHEIPDDTPRFTVRLVVVLTVCIVAAFVGAPALAGWLSALIGAGVR
jgi:ABC-type antimicrobial peptide transport system permease subunit